MADAERIGITIESRDQTSRGFSSAGRGVDALRAKFTGFGSQMESMPDKLGKATAALVLFQGSMSQTSGVAADVANKLVAVAALAATGGPLGVAIAALTGLIALGSSAWEIFTAETREAEKALDSVRRSISATEEQMMSLADQMREAGREEAIAIAGISSEMAALEDQAELAEIRRIRAANEINDILTLVRSNERLLTEEQSRRLAIQRTALATQEQAIKAIDEAINRQSERELAAREAEAAERRRAAAEERRARAAAAWIERLRQLEQEREAEKEARFDAVLRRYEIEEEEARERAELMIALDKRVDSARKALDESRSAARIERLERDAALLEQQTNEAVAMAEAAAAAQIAQYEAVGMAAVDSFGAMVDGTQTAQEAIGNFALSVGKMYMQIALDQVKAAAIAGAGETAKSQTVIAAKAGEGAAKAGAAHADIPFVGIAIAIAAAAAMFAMISKFSKFQFGGMVTGGTPGLDSVPALLTPGEFVIPANQARQIAQGGTNVGDAVRNAAGEGGGRPVSVSFNYASTITPSRRQQEEIAREQTRTVARLRRLGAL